MDILVIQQLLLSGAATLLEGPQLVAAIIAQIILSILKEINFDPSRALDELGKFGFKIGKELMPDLIEVSKSGLKCLTQWFIEHLSSFEEVNVATAQTFVQQVRPIATAVQESASNDKEQIATSIKIGLTSFGSATALIAEPYAEVVKDINKLPLLVEAMQKNLDARLYITIETKNKAQFHNIEMQQEDGSGARQMIMAGDSDVYSVKMEQLGQLPPFLPDLQKDQYIKKDDAESKENSSTTETEENLSDDNFSEGIQSNYRENEPSQDINKTGNRQTYFREKGISQILSIAFPRRIAKGNSSKFIITIFSLEYQQQVRTKIITAMSIYKDGIDEKTYAGEKIEIGSTINIKLSSPEFTFTEEKKRVIEKTPNILTFLGRPNDSCLPGSPLVLLSVLDSITQAEVLSESFEVKVVDYLFGHVSRPLVSKITTAVLAVSSIITYGLTLFEQIDKTFGMTAGTAILMIAGVIFAWFQIQYQLPAKKQIP